VVDSVATHPETPILGREAGTQVSAN
jgi:hypothetical protein